ncbi:hypothetical protein [Streptacidiphilus neutrinimicus]|uniref:hypothetical protein n=1 Tax=Streptacidiphilus neutrinimicus TaxID=105420 RepID=UPI0005A769D3|nr:hypothetical protein [Streptacidiphilus neutrinimicus]
MGLAAGALCAAIGLAGSVALPATAARAASHATATRAEACAGSKRSNPVAVTLRGVRSAYSAGGRWSTLRLTLHNGTRTGCGQLKPVLVYGARDRTLRVDAVRLETRLDGHWRAVPLSAALGELAAAVGPAGGLWLRAGQTTTLTVRMRVARSAPHGEWLSLAVAYAPLRRRGTTVSWPVGVTNPSYFRVVASHASTTRPA